MMNYLLHESFYLRNFSLRILTVLNRNYSNVFIPMRKYCTLNFCIFRKELHSNDVTKMYQQKSHFRQLLYAVNPLQMHLVEDRSEYIYYGTGFLYKRISWGKRNTFCTQTSATSEATDHLTEKIIINKAESPPISENAFIFRHLPAFLHPYAYLSRLHAPIGTWLLFWPCAWSIALAGNPANMLVSSYSIVLCGIGAILMRSSGCIINDLWDRDIDKYVERTRGRPLASGALTPFQAMIYLNANLFLALAVLLQFNPLTILVGLSSMGLVVVYPLMKRITYWPQLVLGLVFNWGALLGWTAATGTFGHPIATPLYLYLAGVCWTMVYDTIYAQQDKEDDKLVGIKSTALLWDKSCTAWLSGFSCAMLCFLVLVGMSNGMQWPYYAATCLTGTHLTWQVCSAISSKKENHAKLFRSNKWIGYILFIGIVSSKVLEYTKTESKKLENYIKSESNNQPVLCATPSD